MDDVPREIKEYLRNSKPNCGFYERHKVLLVGSFISSSDAKAKMKSSGSMYIDSNPYCAHYTSTAVF